MYIIEIIVMYIIFTIILVEMTLVKKIVIEFYQIAEVYDSSKGQVKIGPCRWPVNTDIAFWLDEDDEIILQVTKFNFVDYSVPNCLKSHLYIMISLSNSTCPHRLMLSHLILSNT